MHDQQPDHDQRNHVHSPSLWSQVAADVATSKPLAPSWTETVNKEDLEDLLRKNQPELRPALLQAELQQPQVLKPQVQVPQVQVLD